MKANRSKKSFLKKDFYSKCCSIVYWKSLPSQIFPILKWLPNYNFDDFKGDFIAGLTVGLTVVPQALALAQMANLPLQYGLYSAFMGSFMYAVFGTCKDLVVGPTSVMALMTKPYIETGGPAYATLLAFISGCFQLIFGLFNLGFLVNFISTAVLNGFTTAAALIISVSQIKSLLGLRFESSNLYLTIYYLFKNIQDTNIYDAGMGITCVIILILLKYYKDLKYTCFESPKLQEIVRILWWSLATARNAAVVGICSIIAFVFLSFELPLFTLTQHVEAGLPPFDFPCFSITYTYAETNTTFTKHAKEIFQDLGSGLITIPFLSLLEAIAIAKVFSRSKELKATKEMIAVGMGNLMGSFVSSYPVTGSFSRTVINNTSGVRTPLGGILSGCLVLFALGVIAPSFRYIPKSCLSAMLFSAVIFMIRVSDILIIWKANKVELIPYSVTFLCSTIWGLQYGLFFGVLISLILLLYKQNKPFISMKTIKITKDLAHIYVTPHDCIYFPTIEQFKGKIMKALNGCKDHSEKKVIINGNRMIGIDYSATLGIKSMVASLNKENVLVEFRVTQSDALKALSCLQDTIPFNESTVTVEHCVSNSSAGNGLVLNVDVHESSEPLLSNPKDSNSH